MFTDSRDRFTEFITRNWPTWWQHRLEFPLLGSVGLILVALLIVPIFKSVGVSAEKYYSQARSIGEIVERGMKIRSKRNEPGCDNECKKRIDDQLNEFLRPYSWTIKNYLADERRIPVRLKGRIVAVGDLGSGPENVVDGVTVLETERNASSLSLTVFLVLLVVAGLLAMLWIVLVARSLNLGEAPATRNQPYVALLFFVGAALTFGPYLVGSGLEANFIAPLQRIGASGTPRFERDATYPLFFALTFIGICSVFVKLNRLTGFANTIAGTAAILGIVVGALLILTWTTAPEFIGVAAIAAYVVCVAAIVWKGRDIHEGVGALCLGVTFYFSTLLGPFAIVLWLSHLRKYDPLHNVGDLVPLVVASGILMLISSFVADRASHLPR